MRAATDRQTDTLIATHCSHAGGGPINIARHFIAFGYDIRRCSGLSDHTTKRNEYTHYRPPGHRYAWQWRDYGREVGKLPPGAAQYSLIKIRHNYYYY